MTEEELEKERHIDDDCNVVAHYYRAKMMHQIFLFISKMKGVILMSLGGV